MREQVVRHRGLAAPDGRHRAPCRPLVDEILAARDTLVGAAERLAREGRRAPVPDPRRLPPRPDPDRAGRCLHHRLRGRARSSSRAPRQGQPIRDVAGFLRSLDYAASSMPGPADDGSPQPGRERRRALLEDFRRLTRRRSSRPIGRRSRAEGTLSIAPRRRHPHRTVHAQKAAYEISYEAANRPKWLSVPLRGMACSRGRLQGKHDA